MFPGDSWNEPGTNLYGCLKQLYLLKLKQRCAASFYHTIVLRQRRARNLKVVLSVGGWTYSQSGHFAFVTDVKKRAAFVSSAVTIVENYGFDGMCVIAQLLHRALRGMLTKG
jgi:chitinase